MTYQALSLAYAGIERSRVYILVESVIVGRPLESRGCNPCRLLSTVVFAPSVAEVDTG